MKRSKIKAMAIKWLVDLMYVKKGWRKCLPDSTLLEFWVDHFNEGPQTANFVKIIKQRRNNVTGVTWEDIKYPDHRNYLKVIKRTPNLHIPVNSLPRKTQEIDPWNFLETVHDQLLVTDIHPGFGINGHKRLIKLYKLFIQGITCFVHVCLLQKLLSVSNQKP